MKVLVTGGTGFIGSHLLRLLVEEGCEVHAVMRPGTDTRRIEPVLSHIRRLEADLCDPAGLAAEIRTVRPEICLHLAWKTEPGTYLNSRENLELLNGSCRLAMTLTEAGCRRLVAVGTCFEYDTALGYLSEGSALRPRTLYSAAKASLSLVLEQLARLTGLEVAWLRLFFQYGPHEHPRRLVSSVIVSLLEKRMAAVTLGTQVRDYLHVEDVARAVWAVSRCDVTGAINVGSGRPTTVREIVGTIGTLIGRPELIGWGTREANSEDPPFVCADNRRLLQRTSWRPRYELEEGLRETIHWWRRQLGLRTA